MTKTIKGEPNINGIKPDDIYKPKIYEKNSIIDTDSEVIFEFGGPWGVTAMMIGFPLLMFYLWGCLQFYRGKLVSPLEGELWFHMIKGAWPTWYATKIYLIFCLY